MTYHLQARDPGKAFLDVINKFMTLMMVMGHGNIHLQTHQITYIK